MRLLWWASCVCAVSEKWELKHENQCSGSQQIWEACNVKPCPAEKAIDCVLDDWGDWSDCLCDGLKERHRGIKTANDEHGKACENFTTQTQNCNISCLDLPVNCKMGEWEEWGDCSTTVEANTSERKRTRDVQTPSSNGGQPCFDNTTELQACNHSKPEDIDCEWADWSAWSACTCTCDGGQKTRDRSVKTAPRGQGQRCAIGDDTAPKTEVAPCNTHSCQDKCREGKWGDWNDWGGCTVTCEGGVEWRDRNPEPLQGCDKLPKGDHREFRECGLNSCGDDKDCKLSDWSEWSACSCTCDGIMHRHRRITQYGKGKKGMFCENSTKEVVECNYYSNNPKCQAEKPVNCEWDQWTAWGDCSNTCDGGQKWQTRDILTVHKAGGLPCNGSTKRTTECGRTPCLKDKVNCEWNPWEEWSVCWKCSGEMKRTRTIKTMAENGGAKCKAGASEQIHNCTRQCEEPSYCQWNEWSSWSDCSLTCGKEGQRMRERKLEYLSEAEKKFIQGPEVSQSRLQELTVSFACGSLVTFLTLVVTLRAFRGESQRPTLMGAAE